MVLRCLFVLSFFLSTDRSAGGKFQIEFDETSRKLQDYTECLSIEVTERKNLVDMLNGGNSYFNEKLTEVQSLFKVSSNTCS